MQENEGREWDFHTFIPCCTEEAKGREEGKQLEKHLQKQESTHQRPEGLQCPAEDLEKMETPQTLLVGSDLEWIHIF